MIDWLAHIFINWIFFLYYLFLLVSFFIYFYLDNLNLCLN